VAETFFPADEVRRPAHLASIPTTIPTIAGTGGLEQILPHVDILLPNEREALKISGGHDDLDTRAFAAFLKE